MSELPFILVICSAMAHGYWNFLFKQAKDKDAFLGLTKLAEPVMYFVPFCVLASTQGLGKSPWLYVGVGALLSIVNYTLLSNAYKRLDLALAYPISRSSTIFLPFLAYLFFGEVIDGVGWASVIMVSLGVVVIQLRRRSGGPRDLTPVAEERWGLALALGAAFTVALYTLWGRLAVDHMHPFMYMYCYTLATNLYFYPTLKRTPREVVVAEWRSNKWRILGVSFFNTFSYVLMLFALSLTKVTYVGALRQLSLVFGVALGWTFLREPMNGARVLGLVMIISGACLTYFAR